MNWRFWRKPETVPEAHYNWTPMADAITDLPVIVDNMVKADTSLVTTGRIVRATTAKANSTFESTQASQWSTADYVVPKKLKAANLKPFTIKKMHYGLGFVIIWNTRPLREQIGHWKWLAENPRLALKVVQQARARNQRLLDSALFV